MSVRFLLLVLLFFSTIASSEEYELGQGYKVNDALNIGAYFSLDYAYGKNVNKTRLDDVAVLAYGALAPKVSYFAELEAAPLYVKDFKNDTSEFNERFYVERAYFNYLYSDHLNFRAGKFITPIGYWNLIPINVLRDTSSNPLYSYRIFPKFVSGVDLSGYTDEEGSLTYHLYLQATDDIDEDYINIKNDFFTGVALSYDINCEYNIGASVGYFEAKKGLLVEESRKDVTFVQLNAKYDNYPYLLQTEWAYSDIENKTYKRDDYQFGGYLQGMYNFNEKHALVGRYEYFKDTQISFQEESNIGVIGYSYRPLYAISIKGEYQFHSNSTLSKALLSLSVLF